MSDPTDPRPGKILVMDDEELVLATARLMLRRLGYEVVLAGDVDQAVSLFAAARDAGEPVDAVILDLVIKGSCGAQEAAARLKELEPEVLLVLSSGSSSHPVMENHAELGFQGRINKPFVLAELGAVLGELLP